MHALPLAYITDVPSHITCATPAQPAFVQASSPDAQKEEQAASPDKDRLSEIYRMSFTKHLSILIFHQMCHSVPPFPTGVATVSARLPVRL
jgi:hypothetical protein